MKASQWSSKKCIDQKAIGTQSMTQGYNIHVLNKYHLRVFLFFIVCERGGNNASAKKVHSVEAKSLSKERAGTLAITGRGFGSKYNKDNVAVV
jgi:hypothetical protein